MDTHFFPLLKMQGEVKEISLTLKNHKGNPIPVLVSANKVKQPHPGIGEYRVTLLDIRQRRMFEDDLIASRKKLEEKNKELLRVNQGLEAFTKAVSHDLNAPLYTVGGLIALWSNENPKSSKRKYYLELIERNIQRMKMTIKDLLEYAKIDKLGDNMAMVSLKELALEAMEALGQEIDKNKATINLSELPEVRGNRIQFIRVFQNLFSNAMKYRSKANPEIWVYAEIRENEHLIHVKDNGIGFDMEYGERIFGFMERLHSHDEVEGTGIGLALCKRIIDWHGGRIYASSSTGAGSTFTIALPVRGES